MTEFNSELTKAQTELQSKFEKKREAIKAKLDPELKRLKDEFKAFAKHYEEFTGRRVKFSIGMEAASPVSNGTHSKVSNKDLVLACYADGKDHENKEVEGKLSSHVKNIPQVINSLKSEELLENVKFGVQKITTKGLERLASQKQAME
ncbi:MAG TPA: hypothetical protein VGE97_04140 [Nitrososphaera sp.]